MTVAEATTIRTAALSALSGNLAAGASNVSVGGRSITRFSPKELMELVRECDVIIARASDGIFSAGAFRKVE